MPEIPGRLRPPRISAAPASPAVGEMYYDTVAGILYYWNGNSWVGASGGGLPPTRQVFTSGSGTYTTPAGCRAIFVECIGGGGGGGGVSAATQVGGGGGGGGYAASLISGPAATYSYAVGAGGAGVSGAAGGNGGASTFGTGPLVGANGGNGAVAASGSTPNPGQGGGGGFGGGGSAGQIQANGQTGETGTVVGSVFSGFGGAAARGGAGGPRIASASSAGFAGAAPGGGGGGAATGAGAFKGGDGAAGIVIVTEFYGVVGVTPRAPSRTTYTSGSGTYTVPAGVIEILVECIGGGGAGGGTAATAAGQGACGGGGGGGSYAASLITSPAATYAYAVGAGGTGASAGNGNPGSDTTFGTTVVVGKGGAGGPAGAAATPPSGTLGGAGGVVGTGDVRLAGMPGNAGFSVSATALVLSGVGGMAARGGGGGIQQAGAGGSPGGGGAGAANAQSSAAGTGGAGSAGIIVITEFYGAAPSTYPKTTAQAWSSGPPSSPADGDIWIATAVDANGTVWQFRYNAGSASAYKWEFIGGPPCFNEVLNQETTTSTTYAALTTAGPSFTCQRAGDYIVTLSALMVNNTVNDGGAMSYDVGGTAAIDGLAVQYVGTPVNAWFSLGGIPNRHNGVAASTALVAKYRATTGGTAQFSNRRMLVVPVRVS